MLDRSYAVLIAEDMLLQRQLLIQYCEKLSLQVVGETGSGTRLIEMAAALKPDIILLDIKLNNLSGIEAYRTIRRSGLTPQVIFTTGSNEPEHMLTGINEFDSVGYLTKPIKFAEFQTAIERAIRRILQEQLLLDREVQEANWIRASYHKRDFTFNESAVIYVEKVSKRALHIYLTNDESYRLTSSLQEIQRQSKGALFSPHRTYLVNIYHILHVVPDPSTHGNHLLIMRNDAMIPLTRRQYGIYVELRERIAKKNILR
ncbi:hypothetical protein PRECH8_08220 [Insulibacter thermoxylanivorax]|uniref:Two component transcriptional regulator, LytTR family n=1 Tax=Insulibacter thermoxylanivorax TaxID=2749268 RepID=A0A916QB65_9BACL|nr:response regulator [Insulibacter thermoxylanivorax]GFR37526.1 hypothetical protein PRECH8_08220 [Insulibacter thermoxylanivorax]